MAEISKQEIIEKQRKFLHDISSQLMIAMGMVETTHALLSRDGREADAEKLEKARKALTRMSEMLKAHRSEIKNLMAETKNIQ
ncbi:MAG: hypothetical protein H6624_11355 [Bdellovibrionaceae bacterium]|nr:hypothetical protein [Bdellovibrionales bacterium]MCB9084935.1 hypothetical protein [Pseudobdellovibrionaceae bacterium]